MPKGPFLPSEFVPTKFSTAQDKADFGNTFLPISGADTVDELADLHRSLIDQHTADHMTAKK
jgi:hypothetical protein